MGDKNLWWKLGIIILLVGMCAWQVSFTPSETLKTGIDLGGGHSLTFEIDTSGKKGEDPELAQKVMNVLKQRVDPAGQRNLIWRPIGRNRLEIQMPQATEQQEANRREFVEAREALEATAIRESDVRDAMKLPPDQRQAAFVQMSTYTMTVGKGDQAQPVEKTIESRLQRLTELGEAWDRYQELSAEYEKYRAEAAETQPATEPAETQPAGPTPQEVDEAFNEVETLVERVMDTNLNVNVLVDILSLGRRNETRQEKMAQIRDQHASLVPLIDNLARKHDDWKKDKTSLESPADLIRLLRGAGVLEFRILAQRQSGNPQMLDATKPEYREPVKKYIDNLERYGPRPRPGDNYAWFKIKEQKGREWNENFYVVAEYAGARYVLAHATPDMGLLHTQDKQWKLLWATQGVDSLGRPAIDFMLDAKGGTMFGELTEANEQRPLCIFLDDQAISAATIRSAIYDRGQISGDFTQEDINYIVNTLNAGTLVASLKPVPLQQKSIGPSLGRTNREKGENAVVAALVVTIIFMLVYYNYCGAIADVALMMNLVLTLGVMSFLQATFTLPGIAGLILMLGMAVDANVLIYERIREELNRGVSVQMAVRLGYEKAFSAILDSNVTTIITAVILSALGSEEIKGFGMTLGIGLCTSLFTALFVTRRYFNFMLPNRLNNQETRRVWISAGVLALAGGIAMGLGYMLNTTPIDREDSTWIGLGTFLLWLLGTALVLLITMYLARSFYRFLGHDKTGKLPMMKLLSKPNINWMSKYRPFWGLSAALIVIGALLSTRLDKTDLLDIEFLGGTKVEVEMLPAYKGTTDEQLKNEYLVSQDDEANTSTAEGWLRYAAAQLADARFTPVNEFTVDVNVGGTLNERQLDAALLTTLEDYITRNGLIATDQGMRVQLDSQKLEDFLASPEAQRNNLTDTTAVVKYMVGEAADYLRQAATNMGDPDIQLIQSETEGEKLGPRFEIVTVEPKEALVAESIMAAMGDKIVISQAIDATLVKDPNDAPDGAYLIEQNASVLSDVIGGDSQFELVDTKANIDFKGGLAMVFKDMNPPITAAKLETRLRQMRTQPDFEDTLNRDVRVVGLETADGSKWSPDDRETKELTKVAILVSDKDKPWWDAESRQAWRETVAAQEIRLATTTLSQAGTLERVTQFEAQVASEATQRAMIAIILSLIAIATYLWVRFGSIDFGLAGIIALFHDVAITFGAIMATHWLAGTVIGDMLLLDPFKVDLALIAAFLTIVGYSINDTIVIFDRVRENRGRLAAVSASLVNKSVNETLSRTMITSLTTFLAVFVMYVWGGAGIHGFAFALLVGVVTGTYSTIAIATPMILNPRAMWLVSILIMTIGAIGIIVTIPGRVLDIILSAIVLAVAAFALYRAWLATEGEREARLTT